MEAGKATGETKYVGFETGARKTYNVTPEVAWDYLFSDAGIKTWLGDITAGSFGLKVPYQTSEGNEGKVTVLKELSHVRLSFKKSDWPNTSTLQIRVIKANNKTTISFHHEKLLDSLQRVEMTNHWQNVLATFQNQFERA